MKAVVTAVNDLYAGDCRLDASYHASDGVRALRRLRRWAGAPAGEQATGVVSEARAGYAARRLDRLDEVCKPGGIFIPSRFKRTFVDDPEHGAPYLTGGSIVQADPLMGVKLLSYRFTSKMNELSLRDRMILVTCSGTIGNSVYVNANFHGAIGSPDLLRIEADADKILPGYLYTVLSSPVGQALIEQKTYGAVVPHIEAHHVMDLPIPRLDAATEERIHALVERAASLRVEAAKLLSEAQSKLFQYVDLPRLNSRETFTKGCWCFSVPYEQYGEFALTAWTYNPITQRIIRQIKEREYASLQSLTREDGIFYGHQFKRIDAYPEMGIMLLSQGHVFQEHPQGRWISKRSVSDYQDYMVHDGTILVAAQGTMGESELFGHCQFSHMNFEDVMITQHILRIVPDAQEVHPGYLFAFLSSEYGFQLFRGTECGTKLLGFILPLVQRIPVPMVSTNFQDEIGGMVYQAYDNRAEAVDLENQALALLVEALGI